jgi:hypothetical protein
VIDAMSEPSEAPTRTFVGLAFVLVAFTAIGMFAYSVYASAAESAAAGEGRGGASTLVRASTLQADPAVLPATTATPPLVDVPRSVPDTASRVDRAAMRDGARTERARPAEIKAAVNAAVVKVPAPRPSASRPATKLRYWRAKTAEPDVGF